MKLIVNADDFGYSKGVNLGIIEAHRAGVVTSTTTMVNMGGFE
ncbi:ChbG/HpnK family deacetylase, partial [Mesorhizobium sp. M00.F.Ca.ET.186.01.1.1]